MTEDGNGGPAAPRFSLAAVSDPGRKRAKNEDNCAVFRVSGDRVEPADGDVELAAGETLLLLVADGMGGAAGGEVASGLALDTIADEIDAGYEGGELAEEEIGELLCSALGVANEVIFNEAEERDDLHGMGTTLTGAWIWDEVAHIVQIGDSRAYLYRKGQLQQLTQDQTLVEHLVSTGKMSREEAETAEDRNVILQALGVRPDIDPVLSTVFLQPDDTLFLCSDGLNAVLDNRQIRRLLSEGAEPVSRAVARLVDEANAGGAPDNVTVAMLRVDGSSERDDDAGAAGEPDLTDTQEVPVVPAPEQVETRPYPVVDDERAEMGADEPEEAGEDEPEAEEDEPEADEDEPEVEEDVDSPRRQDTIPEGLPRPETRRLPSTEGEEAEPPDLEARPPAPAGAEPEPANEDEAAAPARSPTQRLPSGPAEDADLGEVLRAPASVITIPADVDPRAVRWFVIGFVVFASTASLLMLVLR